MKIKQQKRKNIIVYILLIIIWIVFNIIFFKINTSSEKINNTSEDVGTVEQNLEVSNAILYNSGSIDDLKDKYKFTGNSDLYEIDTDDDGRKIINIKGSINYKVAFAGLILNQKPNMEDIDVIFNENHPTKNGMWINKKDRESILEYLNNTDKFYSKYSIDNDGYLKINEKVRQTDLDKKLEEIINGSEQYVVSISELCYMVDSVTGEIIDNPYNDLDKYQEYEYFEDDNKKIFFIKQSYILPDIINLINSID